jgi:transposase-like protein
MKGIIEMDETLIGGKNPNRHKKKKVKGCQGRSYKDKTPVFGMLERAVYEVKERPHKRNPNKTVKEKILVKKARVKCFVLHNTTADILDPLILDNVEKDSKVYTDEYNGYNNVCMNYTHGAVNHNRGLYAIGELHSNGIENFWTNAKNTVRGTYIDIRGKYLQSYFNEFTFRRNFNTEPVDNKFRYLIESIKGKRLTYKALTGKAA